MSGDDRGGKRPLIGISTYREQARWGYWDVPAVLLPATYADAVAECGGEPVLLPTGAISAAVVARLDGLILAGGADVDPARYGQSPGPNTTVVRPERDEAELAVLAAALERDLPLLAICRGMQLLNVLLGGDLVQHLPDVPTAGLHSGGPGVFARREVTTAPGTALADLLGPAAPADCHHHQALNRVADGPDARRLGRGRRPGGGRGHRPPVLPRRAVASRGGRGPSSLRGARASGAGTDRVTAAGCGLWGGRRAPSVRPRA